MNAVTSTIRPSDRSLGRSPDGTCRVRRTFKNVGDGERQLSLGAGAMLAFLGLARRDIPGLLIAAAGGALVHRGATGRCHVYHALGINSADSESNGHDHLGVNGVEVVETFLIAKAPEELYNFWRKLENLPAIMSHLNSVQETDRRHSHWIAEAPAVAGGSVEWDAEIVDDQPNKRIAWRSLPEADVDNRGSVEFTTAPGDRGTIVRAKVQYLPPAGRAGHWIAQLFGSDPATSIREDLRNFKRIMEIGDILTTDGQPRGACFGGIGKMMH
jgi:uncharacterized membrane protein